MAEYETVAIPVVKGLDVNTPGRLVDPQRLLEAVNSRFPRGAGATKRRGHVGTVARGITPLPGNTSPPNFDRPTTVPLFSTADRSLPAEWLFGWGAIVNDTRDPTVAIATSEQPDSGLLFGVATRDDEVLAWDGFRLLSRAPRQDVGAPLSEIGPSVMPMLRSTPTAKVNQSQTRVDSADNGRIRVVTWWDGSDVWYTVQDSSNGTTLQPATALGISGALQARCLPIGEWVHILVSSDVSLVRRTINASLPRTLVSQSLGDCTGYFDAWKVSETEFVVVKNTDDVAAHLTWHYANGNENSHTRSSSDPDLGATDTLGTIAVAVHPVSNYVGLVWCATHTAATHVYGRVYSAAGVAVGSRCDLGTVATVTRPVAVASKYLYDSDSEDLFNGYYDQDGGGGVPKLTIARFSYDATPDYTTSQYHLTLASQAFRVGDRTYLWAGYKSTAQSTWFLLDEKLLPVGHCDYITANPPGLSDFPFTSSMNWMADTPKDCVVFHCALGYRVRIPVEHPVAGKNPPAIYTEPSIQFVEMDFLPPLRSVQAGRSTYFAGAQVWSYDGAGLVEADFHLIPEGVTATAGSTGGGLTADGHYIYRVDLCHRNAQNEEVRSHSFYTDSVTVSSGQKVTLTIPTCLTRRTDSYFLIFRNVSDGTLWYLINSRDPSSSLFKKNDLSVASVTFTDDGTTTPDDSELEQLEPHPGNGGFSYLGPFAAPACEIIASGHDRVWVAGGEIPEGQVLPSRLFETTDTPAWNLSLIQQVDRRSEPITAIGFVGETRFFFRRTQTYRDSGDGPDNSGGGEGWRTPLLAYSDMGAIGPDSLGLIAGGLAFQSPAGIRLMNAGGQIVPIGQPVDAIASSADISGVLVSGSDQEIRFYCRSGVTLVYNYLYDLWTTWTVNAVGAARDPVTGLAVLATFDGHLWTETDDCWLDNGHAYNHRIRFAWLRAGNLMDFQRVKRIGGLGTHDPDQPHAIHVDVYYDEREFAEEMFDWNVPDSAGSDNTDTFGSGVFGDGRFGDTTA